MPERSRVLLIFLDGVGLGHDAVESNPFASARLEFLSSLLDGHRPLLRNAPLSTARASLIPLDAALGAAGLPQSGTGQASLLTGHNAVQQFGRHFGPWVPTALRPLVAENNILSLAARAGRSVAFANAYPEELFEPVSERPRDAPAKRRGQHDPLTAGPPLAALAANALTRHTTQLAAGDAVASEITNDGWIAHLRPHLAPITAYAAGTNLARIAKQHELTLFAHYSTDYVGHGGTIDAAIKAVERVDEFLAGVFATLADDVVTFIASDHGNIEDTTQGHTTNPALGLVMWDPLESTCRHASLSIL